MTPFDSALLVLDLTRRASSHGTIRKADRQQARQRTPQSLEALLAGDVAEFEID